MDSGFATAIHQQQTTREIPGHLYQPLLNIALQGYDAKDVALWYGTILHDLRRMNLEDGQAATNAFSMSTEPSLNAPYPSFLDTDCAARRATLATIDSCISPSTKFAPVPSTEMSQMDGDQAQPGTGYAVSGHDSMSQAYNTPQSYQAYTTTPQHLDATPESPPSQQLMTSWSPAPSSAAEPDLYALPASASMSNGNLVAFTGEPTTAVPSYPWFGGQDVGSLHSRTHSQQSHLSQHSMPSSSQQMAPLPPHPQQSYLSPDYNTHLSSASMPVLVPYASSGGSGNYTRAAAIPAGPGASIYTSSAGFFPIIHVSSSRRRRKALHKGVKKMVQPLKGRRQQSV